MKRERFHGPGPVRGVGAYCLDYVVNTQGMSWSRQAFMNRDQLLLLVNTRE